MRIRTVISVLFCLLFTPVLLAQPGPPKADHQVNTFTAESQNDPGIAASGNGRYVVVWRTASWSGSLDGVFGQIFEDGWVPVGSEFQVASGIGHGRPAVGMDALGGFVVVYESTGSLPPPPDPNVPSDPNSPITSPISAGLEATGPAIRLRRFDPTGSPLGGEIVLEENFFGLFTRRADLAMLPSGEFAVAWTRAFSDGSSSRPSIVAMQFDSTGTPSSGVFQVNEIERDRIGFPSIAMDIVGGFMVTWTGSAQERTVFDIYGRRFDSLGVALGHEFVVNSYTTGTQEYSDVSAAPDSSFVVVWGSYEQVTEEAWSISGRRFDSGGVPIGAEFRVHDDVGVSHESPVVDVSESGSFVVAWSAFDYYSVILSESEIMGRVFSRSGVPRGPEFQINSWTTAGQWYPDVASAGPNEFVVAWSSADQDGSSYGIFGDTVRGRGVSITRPARGATLSCDGGWLDGNTVEWERGDWDRFQVFLGSGRREVTAAMPEAASPWMTGTSWTPPMRRWRSLCRAELGRPAGDGVLYLKVVAQDTDLSPTDPGFSSESELLEIPVSVSRRPHWRRMLSPVATR